MSFSRGFQKPIMSSQASSCPVQAELQEKLTKMYDVRDQNQVQVFGFRTQVWTNVSCMQLLDTICMPIRSRLEQQIQSGEQ